MGECNHAGQMIGISDGSSIYAWKCLNCGQQFPRNAFVRGKWRVDSANERLKGGDANADPTGSNTSTKSIPATSPGVTAGASEIDAALHDLDGFSSCGDHLTEVPLVTRMRTTCGNAAALIRRLEMYVRKPSVYMDAYYDQRVRDEIDDRYRFSDDDETYIETWEATKAMREALEHAESRAAAAEAEVERLRFLINSPHVDDWFDGVRIEAAHQVERWGAEHDAGKTPLDWFWLIGYLAQKAVHAAMSEDAFKAKHHTISTGAALLNWYRRMIGDSTRMRPGLSDEAHQKIDGACTALENKSDG